MRISGKTPASTRKKWPKRSALAAPRMPRRSKGFVNHGVGNLAIAAITGVDSHWLETGEVPEAGEN